MRPALLPLRRPPVPPGITPEGGPRFWSLRQDPQLRPDQNLHPGVHRCRDRVLEGGLVRAGLAADDRPEA